MNFSEHDVARTEQPNRIRLVSSRDGFVERRRRNRRDLEDMFEDDDAAIELLPIIPKTISRTRTYWPYVIIFLLFCAVGGFLVAALGLFEGIGA